MKPLSQLLFVSLFLTLTSAYAFDTDTPTTKSLLIDSVHLIPPQILPPAPGSDSAKGKVELLHIKTLVGRASTNERELATKDASTKNVSFFADVIPGFEIEKLPKTKALFDQVRFTEDFEAKLFKDYFMRKRPFELDPSILPCEPPRKGDEYKSYPSGHATMGYSMGIILAHLIPEKSAVIMDRATLYAENRLICGVHHLSDINAGQVLGSIVATLLLQNADFQKMLQASKQELSGAGLTQ
ncbi:acid phosphatase (class A) [Polynucleobacter meluiroseus]|uniref:Acid phosphatase n=2 Tax=Polynucleobacter meluiroseus TaxID=1938814 RepID=A0A240E0C8_9BURK|nr:acid phosphatase (class A) [Polynucleobacter meluiroseus]